MPCFCAAPGLTKSSKVWLVCDGDLARRFAIEDAHHHLAGLAADVVVVQAQRGNGAALDAIGVGGDHRDLRLLRHLDDAFEGRHDVVVGRRVDHVDLADQALRGTGHVDAARRRGFDQHQAGGRGGLLQRLDDGHRIGFAGAVDHADALGVRRHLLDQLEVLVQRRHVRHAGDVGARRVPALHQLGRDRVGDGAEDHRDVLGCGDHGLGRRRGDGDDGVGLAADVLARDLRGGAGVALGALEFVFQVLAGFEAGRPSVRHARRRARRRAPGVRRSR